MSRIYDAIKKAEESRSKGAWESGGGLGVMELLDRRRDPAREPGVKPALHRTSGELPVELEPSTMGTLNPAAPGGLFLVAHRPEIAEIAEVILVAEAVPETDFSLPSDESIMGSNTLPVLEAVEALELAFSCIYHESVAEATALQAQEEAKDVEIVPDFSPSLDAVSTATIPMQETPAATEQNPCLVADHDPADVPACPAREAAVDVPRADLVVRAKEELPPQSLLAFYGLNQQPFDVTPDPAYLYLSRAHREALTSLTQGIENLRGFMTLVANPGLGKTTLLNKLTEDLGNRARVVHLFQTQCNSSELLRYLLNELGVPYDATDVVAMHRTLNDVLFQEMLQGRRFVLIVDEAQNLQDSVLETIRLLSDFETTHSKLIQIVLAGQPQLVHTLLRPGLSQLRQRIGMVANLKPLDAAEVAEYVEHRLRTAGASGKTVFTRDALMLIAEQCEGTPRSINNLCFNALLLGHSMSQAIIDIEIVERAAVKLDLELLALSSYLDEPN